MTNTNEQLKHRLTMIQDDLIQLRAFIYANNLAEAFEKSTEVSDEAWTLLNNIDIACDLSSDESLTWQTFNK
jgi:ubiquinone biosynthesis protein COQ9